MLVFTTIGVSIYYIQTTLKLLSNAKAKEIHNNNVYTKIPIIDFFHKTIGYIVIKDNIFQTMQTLKEHAKTKMSIEIFSYLMIFTIIFILN